MAILLILLALFAFVLGGSSSESTGTARQFAPTVCSNRMTTEGDSGLCRHADPAPPASNCSKRMGAAPGRRECEPPARP